MRRFLKVWLAILFGAIAAVVAINAFLDPYGIVGAPRIPGVNADKIAAADWPRITKAYLVERAKPNTLALGTSSVDVGIDPESPSWPDGLRPVFNLAIDGGSIETMLRWEQHALATTKPKLVIVGISLEESLVFPPAPHDKPVSAQTQAEFSFEARMRVRRDGTPNPDYDSTRLSDAAFALLSLRALGDGITGLLGQNDHWKSHETALGFNSGGNLRRWTETEGSYSLVMTKDRDKVATYLAWSHAPRFDVDALPQIIDLARDHGAEVKVFILPNYADQMELYSQVDVVGAFEQWKTRVAGIVDAASRARGGVALWDFSGFSSYTTETLPGPGIIDPHLKWFYEPIHFQPVLGSLMIGRMLGAPEPSDFGRLLTPITLAEDLAAFRQGLRAWEDTHPADIARIGAMVAEAREAAAR